MSFCHSALKSNLCKCTSKHISDTVQSSHSIDDARIIYFKNKNSHECAVCTHASWQICNQYHRLFMFILRELNWNVAFFPTLHWTININWQERGVSDERKKTPSIKHIDSISQQTIKDNKFNGRISTRHQITPNAIVPRQTKWIQCEHMSAHAIKFISVGFN